MDINDTPETGPDVESPEESSGRQKRSLNLIAEFVDGYAKGWRFAVGEAFKDVLDIKYTERVENKKRVMRWTQGPFYSFAEGYIIYDCPEGYLKWDEALRHLGCACFITSAKPNAWSDLDPKTKKRKLINGEVRFRLSKPNRERTRLEPVATFTVTQTEFVTFLRDGTLQRRDLRDILE